MTAFLLLRHAASVWNEDGRFQGWADPPLSGSGRQAARRWALIAEISFDAVVSSDLIRSRATAELIAEGAGLGHVDVRCRLREQDQGAWTGLTKADVKRMWPDRARQRPREPFGGETQAELSRRVIAELDDLASQYTGRRVLVVTHSGVIKAVERALGCDDVPVPHLHGRWVVNSSGDAVSVSGSHASEDSMAHWTAGPAVPESRGRQRVVAGDRTGSDR